MLNRIFIGDKNYSKEKIGTDNLSDELLDFLAFNTEKKIAS